MLKNLTMFELKNLQAIWKLFQNFTTDLFFLANEWELAQWLMSRPMNLHTQV